MSDRKPTYRWYHFTPGHFFVGLLAVQVFLLLSERFQWFGFNERKGWTVLIAVGVVGVAVLAMLVWGLVCGLLRRRWQFGIRSLLVFVVVLSIPLGWFAWEMQRAKRQREAVEMVRGVGSTVRYDYEVNENRRRPVPREPTTPSWLRESVGVDFFSDVVEVYCDFGSFGDEDVKQLKELTSLRTLTLCDTQTTDRGLTHLKGTATLERLCLDNTLITDNGLEDLRGLPRLRSLDLSRTRVTDQGLENLRGFGNLETLCLSQTHTTDVGLAHLSGMAKLRVLCLDHTQVTNAGLEHLKELAELENLGLGGTMVTDEGLKKLRQALPNCWIER